jgi:hypothetical protein
MMKRRNGERAKRRTGEAFLSASPLLRFAVSIPLLLLLGCSSQTGPDSNPEVFKTVDQASAARKQKLLLDWQEMTMKIANAERPDVRTIKAEGFAVKMSADGVERTIDLTPLHEKLDQNTGKEREPIRAYLADQFPVLDRARLKAIGFERARPMLRPMLANTKRTGELTPVDTKQPPITNRVVIDLNWVPVVQWPGTQARTAVDADLAGAWGVTGAQVSAAAMENLRRTFAARSEAPFETIELPGLGRYGTLRSGVDPAVMLLPEFIAAVRAEWKTADDLVISFPSPLTISFLEQKNEKLLKTLMPEWSKLYTKVSDPMIGTMILATDKGLSLYSYAATPATKPATQPATKRVYIVH